MTDPEALLIPIKLEEMQIQGGTLRSLKSEGNGFVLANLDGKKILLPKAGLNLQDLIGQRIELGCIFGKIRVRLANGDGERVGAAAFSLKQKESQASRFEKGGQC